VSHNSSNVRHNNPNSSTPTFPDSFTASLDCDLAKASLDIFTAFADSCKVFPDSFASIPSNSIAEFALYNSGLLRFRYALRAWKPPNTAPAMTTAPPAAAAEMMVVWLDAELSVGSVGGGVGDVGSESVEEEVADGFD